SDPAELIETAKRVLAKGKLEVAENYLIRAMRTVMLDNSYKRSPEPYRYLAEVLERKAQDKNLELPQRQRFLLQAAALYNFVRNFLKTLLPYRSKLSSGIYTSKESKLRQLSM
ncbi:Hypothetical predicted protein, partial [Paramuricea clavata]